MSGKDKALSTFAERSGDTSGVTISKPVCHTCVHWKSGVICAAFPKGIPDSVLMGKANHRTPIPGDHGLKYIPKIP